MKFFAFIAVCAVAAPALTITRRDDVPGSHYLLAATAHPSVGIFNLGNGAGDADRSGTLIGDKFVLTAGHNQPPVGSSPTFRVGGNTYSVVSWSRHPSYSSNVSNGNDLLVARLGARVLNVRPARLATSSIGAGAPIEIVGAGRSGTGTNGSTVFDLQMRAATNVIDVDPALPNVFLSDFDKPGDPSKNLLASLGSGETPSTREGNVAAGDSGGPVFASAAGEWQLVGVISAILRSSGPAGSYGDGAMYSRISNAISFIRDRAWETGRVDGLIQLEDVTTPLLGRTATIQLYAPGSSSVLETVVVPLATHGGYSFVTSRRGPTDVRFSVPGFLSKRATNANITNNGPSGLNAVLVNGDVNRDNEVGPADFAALSTAFGTFNGDPTFSAAADLNDDGEVGPADFAILARNFGEFGDN